MTIEYICFWFDKPSQWNVKQSVIVRYFKHIRLRLYCHFRGNKAFFILYPLDGIEVQQALMFKYDSRQTVYYSTVVCISTMYDKLELQRHIHTGAP